MFYPNSLLVTSAAGVFNTSGTGQAFKGFIEKIVITSQTWANGSLFISSTRDSELILTNQPSGTLKGIFYPRTIVSSSISGTSLSGTGNGGYERIYVNGPISISGIGLGNTTSGTLTIYYNSY